MDTLPGPLADALERASRPEVAAPQHGAGVPAGAGGLAHPRGWGPALCLSQRRRGPHDGRVGGPLRPALGRGPPASGAGDFDRWFRARNRHDLVAKAKSARLEADADAALEAFLRRLNPRLASAPADRRAPDPGLWTGGPRRKPQAPSDRAQRDPGLWPGHPERVGALAQLEPVQVGCLAGTEASVTVRVDMDGASLRRDHQAVVACTPDRGARISIPVSASV